MKRLTFRSNTGPHWRTPRVKTGLVTLAALAVSAVSLAGIRSSSKTHEFDAHATASVDSPSTAVLDSIMAFNQGIQLTGATAATPQPTCIPPPSGMVSWWPGDGNAN